MVVRLLDLPGVPSSDAADALACATCQAHGTALVGALAIHGAVPPRRSLKSRRGRLVES
jgi:crossover junction endodeoxyribonuclease RuvC